MNTYERKTVVQLSEQLHICMVKAIDTAMSKLAGEDWFASFKAYDSNQDIPILDKSQTSVNRMDLQACLKFFRYREDYAKIVFEYFGHNFYEDSDDAKKAQLLLNQRLDNLIHNVRNYLFAHASATMVEDGKDDSMRYSVYGADEAVNDMLKIAGFFSAVTDDNGASYYHQMQKMAKHSTSYSITEVLEKEHLKVTIGEFVEVCNKLNISISTNTDGNIRFYSENYIGDMARIKLLLNSDKKKTSKIYILGIVIFILVVLLSNAATVLIMNSINKTEEYIPDDKYKEKFIDVNEDTLEDRDFYNDILDLEEVEEDAEMTFSGINLIDIRYAYWFDNGDSDGLGVEIVVGNAYDYTVKNLGLSLTIFDNNERKVASGVFLLPRDFVLRPGEKDVYVVYFCDDDLLIPDADLSMGVGYAYEFTCDK